MITLTCILVPLSLLTVWVHDIVLDTDRYVSTVAPLASDPDVQAAAVHRITEAADVRVDGAEVTSDLAKWLESQGLPPRVGNAVKALGPQLDSAADAAVSKVATRFVEGDRFEKIWTTANRAAHNAVGHALTGEGRGALEVQSGTVTLNIGEAVDKVKEDLVKAGISPPRRFPRSTSRWCSSSPTNWRRSGAWSISSTSSATGCPCSPCSSGWPESCSPGAGAGLW
ncbi:hypothetical protein ACFSNO_13115 [Streptomyces cirratus]